MEAGFEYPESDALRTLDERYSVIRVGDEIADILTEAGISVLHDTQPNDYPNYNGAYERMRQTIEGYLAEYPSIQMVLDIHRDAAEDADGNPLYEEKNFAQWVKDADKKAEKAKDEKNWWEGVK